MLRLLSTCQTEMSIEYTTLMVQPYNNIMHVHAHALTNIRAHAILTYSKVLRPIYNLPLV